MRISIVAAAAVLSAAVPAGHAAAQELLSWGASDYWDVLIDPTLGNGCLIQTEFTDGSVVRIGFDNIKGIGYMTAFNDAWGTIIEGETYQVFFSLDGAEYMGEGIGVQLHGVPGTDIEFDSADFLFDIAQRQTMTLYNIHGEVMSIDLTGSYQALEAAMKCQDEQG